jgi:hypothetical protein
MQSAGLYQIVAPYIQSCTNTRDVVIAICSTTEKTIASLFAMLVWVLWNNRNNRVWISSTKPGRSLGYKARHLWQEWFYVQQVQHMHHMTVRQQPIAARWMAETFVWLEKMQHRCGISQRGE